MKNYPTDEELELFIRQMEEQELYAPKHMKEQILSQAFPNQFKEALPDSGSGGQTIQFLAYRIKIIAGMAAAVLMLVTLPMQGRDWQEQDTVPERKLLDIWEQEMEQKDTMDINNMLNEGTRKVNRKMNVWLEGVNNLWNRSLFEKKDGGYIYEN